MLARLYPVGSGAMVSLSGVVLCFCWYYTILSGFYVLYCPALYLMFFNDKLYRTTVDILFSLWELYPVGLFQWCCSTKVHHYGDYVDKDETCILILNHRTRVDWNYVWMSLYHATQDPPPEYIDYSKRNYGGLFVEKQKSRTTLLERIEMLLGGKSKLKIVLKDELKSVPGLGWIMQLNYFLYLKRDWRIDQANMAQFVDYCVRARSRCRLVLFPEGTDLSDHNRKRSDKFADDNHLTRFKYVLHPRTLGWSSLCTCMRGAGLASVYDVTVAYDRPAQNEADLLDGRWPDNVHFYFKRYSIEQLPRDEEALKTWINNRWQEKEDSLKCFHENGHFTDPLSNGTPVRRSPRPLTIAKLGFIFWCVIDLVFIYGLLYSVFFLFWFIYHSLLFAIVTWKYGGFHNIQYNIMVKRQLN